MVIDFVKKETKGFFKDISADIKAKRQAKRAERESFRKESVKQGKKLGQRRAKLIRQEREKKFKQTLHPTEGPRFGFAQPAERTPAKKTKKKSSASSRPPKLDFGFFGEDQFQSGIV